MELLPPVECLNQLLPPVECLSVAVFRFLCGPGFHSVRCVFVLQD